MFGGSFLTSGHAWFSLNSKSSGIVRWDNVNNLGNCFTFEMRAFCYLKLNTFGATIGACAMP
jgi:hypothetical protein